MRRVLALTGPDTEDFLQDLVTNDIAGLARGAVYAALLTPQGKLIADFFLVRRDDAILMDLPEDVADSVAKRLTLYKLRRKVEIADSGLSVARGTGPAPEGAVADPRHPSLGWRLYGDSAETDGSDFDALRVAACVPEWGSELGPETFILEAGFERLHGVDFRKGCYVGQEVTARMHHKTELRKGFVTVSTNGSAPVGTAISRDGKPVGTLHTQADGAAIAYLRFDRAGPDMQAGDATVSWTG